ncbi:DUF7167 family protein [Acinetobacter radioresistens]|uniref:DUF7167 family protein n=1 Tax=Acinetobacter radioresistens TaxID=40216 RepID=UPI00125F0A2E|nr:hypothetical protein [Acinetobacter radioresistens]
MIKNFEEQKVRLYLSIGYAASAREDSVYLKDYISESEWNALSPSEQENFLYEEILKDWESDHLDSSASLEEST